MSISIQELSAVIFCVGNRKCIFNCIKTLLHSETGRSQITDQLLCGCECMRRENLEMDGRDSVRVWREVFHPLISEAAGALLSGLGGQGCDMNV